MQCAPLLDSPWERAVSCPTPFGSKSLFISCCRSSHACVHVFATCSADYLGKGQCCNCSTDLSVYFLLCNMKHELTQPQSTDFKKICRSASAAFCSDVMGFFCSYINSRNSINSRYHHNSEENYYS